MIFGTNRTASLGETTVDVNESYFGYGSLYFMQECANDELALFEAAVKSDIDEVLIRESGEGEYALNESVGTFVEKVVNKIKEMMRKFKEWLMGIMRSVIAKLSQIIVRDNKKFCKQARTMMSKMKNKDKFKLTGKVLTAEAKDIVSSAADISKGKAKDVFNAIIADKSVEELKSILNDKEDNDADMRNEFNEAIEEVDLEGKAAYDMVTEHIKFLESDAVKNLKETVKKIKKISKNCDDIVKTAQRKANNTKDDDENKEKMNTIAELAAAFKSVSQKECSDAISILKESVKIARAVVTKGMGATPKNEGVEYTEELVQAMIESFEYECDSALEEMSEGKECCDDDIDDIDDEE